MADTKNGARFVRCPKCKQVIVEFATIPIYQCGGCNTILQAKRYNSAEQNGSSQSLENNTSGKLKVSGTLKNDLSPHAKVETNYSTQVQDLDSSQLISLRNNDEKVELVKNGENNFVRRGSSDVPVSNHFNHVTFGSNKMDITIMQDNEDYNTESKADDCLNVNVKHLQLSSKSSEGLHNSADFSSTNISSNNEKDNKSNEFAISPKSIRRKSTDYDNGVLSPVHNRYNISNSPLPLLLKTSSQRVLQDFIDTKASKGGETNLTVSEKASGSRTELPAQDLTTNVFHKRNSSNGFERFIGDVDVMPSQYKTHGRQNVSLESEDFYSIYNWFEPEIDKPCRSPAQDAKLLEDLHKLQPGSPLTRIKYVESIRAEILKKVNELKDEINDAFSEFKQREERFFPRQNNKGNYNHSSRSGLLHNHSGPFGKSSPELCRLAHGSCCLHCHDKGCKSVKLAPKICCCIDPYSEQVPMYLHCRPCCIAMPQLPIAPACGLSCKGVHRHEYRQEQTRQKEKRQSEKQFLRPVLGGAPFVICHKCLKLLQLPVDFCVTQKKLYKLQCSSCSQVLVFSFKAGKHGFVQTHSELHLSSEVDNSSDKISLSRTQIG